jgi:hypothetical protein
MSHKTITNNNNNNNEDDTSPLTPSYQVVDQQLLQIRARRRNRRKKQQKKQGLPSLTTSTSNVKCLERQKEEMRLAEQAQFQATKRALRKKLTILRSEFNRLKHETDHLKTTHRDLTRNLSLLSRNANSSSLKSLQATLQEASRDLENMNREVTELRKYDAVLKHTRDRLAKESHSYPKTLRSYEAVLNARTAEIEELKDAVANAQHARDTAKSVLERSKRDCKESLEILTKERDGRLKMLEEEQKVLQFFKEKQNKNISSSSVDKEDNGSLSQLRDVMTHHNAHEEAMRQIFALTGLTKEEDIIRAHRERQERIEEIELHVKELKQEVKTSMMMSEEKTVSSDGLSSRDSKEEDKIGEL